MSTASASENLKRLGQPWWSDYDTEELLGMWTRIVAVVELAERYRAVSLADPLSLERPTLGSALDRALADLARERSTKETAE